MCEQTGLPPSAKLVKKVIVWHGPLSYGEIVEEAELPETTVDGAIRRLREQDVVRKVYEDDARSPKYAIEN